MAQGKEKFCQHRDQFGNRCNTQVQGARDACSLHDAPNPRDLFTSRVYFVECAAASAVKIGTATDVSKRFGALQTSSPLELRLIGSVAGGLQVERWMHFHLFADRSRFEWFNGTPRVRSFISAVLSHGPWAAESMCPRHLLDDIGGDASGLDAMPGRRSDIESYLEANRPLATPLGRCFCASCGMLAGDARPFPARAQ